MNTTPKSPSAHAARGKAKYPKRLPAAWTRIAGVFVALGDPHRQRILLMLDVAGRMNIGEIVAASTLSRSAVVHHLRVLRDAGVLKSERIGKEVQFWPDIASVGAALATLQDYLAERR